MKFKSFSLYLMLFLAAFSCSKAESTLDNPGKGEITVAADESFKSVSEALTERYMALNPNTRINLQIKKEDLAFLDLLKKKVRVIVMSRELSAEEKAAFKSELGTDIEPAPFAADAAVFVVSSNSPRTSISVEEIKQELNSDSKKIIFDGTNSSNLNFVAQKIGKKPGELKFSIISGNRNVLQELDQHPEKIGVVSLNTFSRPFDPQSVALRKSLKILPVSSGGQLYEPQVENLREMSYPFTRVLYFLTNESYYGLGNGFIRFSCQQLGQIVVEKEGLQPYNIFRREVQMH